MRKRSFTGLIADTHGLVRPEALAALAGAELILHAGDIGKPEVLSALEEIAPVLAIRGNVDVGEWARSLPERRELELFGRRCLLLHNVKELEAGAAQVFDAIIYGHSHKPECRREGSVLFLNPGSAGPRRFRLPVAVGKLYAGKAALEGEILLLS